MDPIFRHHPDYHGSAQYTFLYWFVIWLAIHLGRSHSHEGIECGRTGIRITVGNGSRGIPFTCTEVFQTHVDCSYYHPHCVNHHSCRVFSLFCGLILFSAFREHGIGGASGAISSSRERQVSHLSECGESLAALDFWSAAIYCRFDIFWIATRPRVALDPRHVPVPLCMTTRLVSLFIFPRAVRRSEARQVPF